MRRCEVTLADRWSSSFSLSPTILRQPDKLKLELQRQTSRLLPAQLLAIVSLA